MNTQSKREPGRAPRRRAPGKEDAAALARRIADLEDQNRELAAFNVAVAHELRAPLRLIEAMGGILGADHEAALSADARALLRIMRDSAGRLNKMIDDLLSLSRLARHGLAHGRTDLGALAREAGEALQRAEPKRRVELRIAPGLTAWCDPDLARQLIAALLANAWKFTATRAQAVIEVGMHDRDRGAFVVRDNGIGFDMQYAARLFLPFQRLHGIDEAAGAGLGLTLARRIVERHGGRIWAESAPQAGAAFYFMLEEAKP